MARPGYVAYRNTLKALHLEPVELEVVEAAYNHVATGGGMVVLEHLIQRLKEQFERTWDVDLAYAHACAQQGGNLVTQRLAAAGGHEHQGVAAGAHMADDVALDRAAMAHLVASWPECRVVAETTTADETADATGPSRDREGAAEDGGAH